MFSVDNDMTILITRGDTAVIPVVAVVDDGSNYVFQPDDVIRFKVFEKKNCDNVILEVDFSVEEETEQVDLVLTEQHTTIGGIINKPVDYWYEVELNPLTNPQTIIGYDDDGPKIFRLYPEGKEVEPLVPKPEAIEIVDSQLNTKSTNPIQNQVVARAIINIETAMDENKKKTDKSLETTEKKITNEVNQRSKAEQRIDTELAILRGRINVLTNLPEGSTALDAEVIDARIDFTGRKHGSAGDSVRTQFSELFTVVGCGKNLFNPNDPDVVDGKMFDDSGELNVINAAYMTTGFIMVKEGHIYFATYQLADREERTAYMRSFCFYDENKNVVTASASPPVNAYIEVPTGQNIKYIRVTLGSPNGNNPAKDFQFEAHMKSTYEPYHLIYEVNNMVEKEVIVKTSSTINLFSATDVYENVLINDDNPTYYIGNSSYVTTKPIYVNGFDYLVCQNTSDSALPRAMVFFDSVGNVLAHYSSVNQSYPATVIPHKMTSEGSNSRIPIPESAVTVCVSVRSDTQIENYMIYCIKGKNVNPIPIPYVSYSESYRVKQDIEPLERYIKSYFNGKKMVVIGDSITQGYTLNTNERRWAEQVASMFNMSLVNYGIGGSEIAQFKVDDNTYNPMCIRYAEMDDADLIIVAGGTNDWNHTHTTLGEFGDTSINTFYGALDTICKGLLSKYVGKNIMFITPIKRWHALAEGAEYYNPNSMGYILEQFVNAIKKVCGFYGIPVLDMFNECTLNPIVSSISEAYIPDGTHPNYEGHKIMARQIAGFISKIANDIDYN